MTRELAMQMKEDAYETLLSGYARGADWDILKGLLWDYKYWSSRVRQLDTQLTLW
jgi:hypothetical protein